MGYTRKLPAGAGQNDPGEAPSLEIARATLSSWLRPDEQSRLTGPETKEQSVANSVTRSYSWRLPAASHPELDLRYQVSVRGEQVVGETIEKQGPRASLCQNEPLAGFGFRINQQRISGLTAVSIILYWLVFAVVLILGIYRFIQRARQRELSFKRIAILTVIIAFLFLAVILIRVSPPTTRLSCATRHYFLSILSARSHIFSWHRL